MNFPILSPSFYFFCPSIFLSFFDSPHSLPLQLIYNSEKEIAPHLFRPTYLFLSFFFSSSKEEKKLKARFRPFLAPSSPLMCVCLQVSEVPEHNISASLKVQMHHFELLLLDLGNDVWFQLISHFVLQVEFRLFHCKLRSRPDPSVGKS